MLGDTKSAGMNASGVPVSHVTRTSRENCLTCWSGQASLLWSTPSATKLPKTRSYFFPFAEFAVIFQNEILVVMWLHILWCAVQGSNLSHDQVVGAVPTTRLHSRTCNTFTKAKAPSDIPPFSAEPLNQTNGYFSKHTRDHAEVGAGTQTAEAKRCHLSMMCEDGGDDNDEDDEEDDDEEEEEEDDEYVEDRGQNKWSGKASGALILKNGTNSYHNAETGQAGTSQCRKQFTRRKADTLHCDGEKGVKEEKAPGNTVRFVDRQVAEASVVGVDNKPVTRRGTCVTVHRPGSGKKKGSTLEADGLPALFHCTHPGCEKVYRVKEYLSNHVKAVHGARRHVCPQPGCGKRFVLQRHLRKHLVLHSEERNFLCATCGASFKSKKNLLVHLRIHTGEKPLQCELCGYRCRQKASLNWHMKKHNVESNFAFACGLCGKRFEKSDNLRCHQLKSHPDREQSSPACQIDFPVMADRLSETSTPLSST
uniref:C2H2-type domain-containing protein n=1 Tax=Eptatretus burgeri TaxID=7764 RepID=A0A8C4QVV0_EPTBU